MTIKRNIITTTMLAACLTASADNISGRVIDAANNEAIPYATVTITDMNGKKHSTVSDISGNFSFANMDSGRYTINVSYLGYHNFTQTCTCRNGMTCNLTLKLKQDTRTLNEVVVTAHESQGITTSSVIDRKAIEHLQPSSFTDLLSLLPGGTTQLPDLTNANSIKLRQAGTGNSNYDISSMGTVFVTDGIPINSNANMQLVKQA